MLIWVASSVMTIDQHSHKIDTKQVRLMISEKRAKGSAWDEELDELILY